MTKDGDWALESKWRPLGQPRPGRPGHLVLSGRSLSLRYLGSAQALASFLLGVCHRDAPPRGTLPNAESAPRPNNRGLRLSVKIILSTQQPKSRGHRRPAAAPARTPVVVRQGPARPAGELAARNTCVRVTATRTGHGTRRGDETDVRVPEGLSRHEPGRGKRGACTSQSGGPGCGAQGQLGSVTETEVPGHALR